MEGMDHRLLTQRQVLHRQNTQQQKLTSVEVHIEYQCSSSPAGGKSSSALEEKKPDVTEEPTKVSDQLSGGRKPKSPMYQIRNTPEPDIQDKNRLVDGILEEGFDDQLF